jgi:hypothetical protein
MSYRKKEEQERRQRTERDIVDQYKVEMSKEEEDMIPESAQK